jgi:asparagine synthase (glutamine-hydrolysing)
MSALYGRCLFGDRTLTANELSVMEQPLHHWKTDAMDTWMHHNVGLGHLMLYNTPESVFEKLPFHAGSTNLTITADARIDNREALFTLLHLSTAAEKKISDSGLILLLYKKFKQHCVQHLVGDFAFAIWDGNKQELFCARDQLGVKPFFYYKDDNFFAFASELKGLLAIPELNKNINRQFLYNQFFLLPEQEVDTTLYQNIHRLSPAHTLVLNLREKKYHLTRYWDLDADTEIHFTNPNDYYATLRFEMERAVQCRLRSNYAIGTELSGGIDSSSITGIASYFLRGQGKHIIPISNTIPEHVTDEALLENSERHWIDDVIAFNKIEKYIFTSAQTSSHAFEQIDFMLHVNDGLDSWQQQWQMPIRQSAQKEGLRTVLSGFPGDEMVTYRGKYYFLDYLDHKKYLKYILAKKKYPGFHKLDPFIPHAFRYRLHLLKNAAGLYNKKTMEVLQSFNIPAESLTIKGDVNWLSPLVKAQFKNYRYHQKWRFLRNHVPARMESETRNGLYFGFEPRFPMADIRLVQYYLSMPNHLKYEGNLARSAFRKAMQDYLPQSILERDNKRGTMAPYMDADALERKMKEEKEHLEQLLKNLKGNPFINPSINKKNKINTAALRWLAQNPGFC